MGPTAYVMRILKILSKLTKMGVMSGTRHATAKRQTLNISMIAEDMINKVYYIHSLQTTLYCILFPCKPKHFGAAILILICFINSTCALVGLKGFDILFCFYAHQTKYHDTINERVFY